MVKWLACLLWGIATMGMALPPDTIRLSQTPMYTFLHNRATIQETPLSVRSPSASVLAKLLTPSYRTQAQQAYWLQVYLQNDTHRPQQVYLYGADNQCIDLYLVGNDRTDSLQTGSMIPTYRWATDENDQYIPFRLRPHETVQVVIRLARASSLLPFWTHETRSPIRLNVRLERESYHYQRVFTDYRNNMPEFQYRSWFQGALLFFGVFVGILYGRYRQRLYRYYWFYVLAGCTFALLKTRSYTPIGHWLSYVPLLRTYLSETVMWLGLGAYLFFLIELLDLPQHHQGMARWFRRIAWGTVCYSFIYILTMLLTNDPGFDQVTFWITRLVLIPLYVGVLIWIGREVGSPLTRYVILGNALMALVGLLAWLRAGEVILKGVRLPGSIDDMMTISFAVLLEILVFALAVARRIQLLDQERHAHQRAYITQLEENRRLIAEANQRLEANVREKTSEMLAANRKLEAQRVNQLRTDYEKRIAQIEMLALRSQMNPHFLFNSLNTLEYFILSGQRKKASDYLTTFSRLLRMTLNHSREEVISLDSELTALGLYLTIESTRFDQDFHYSVEVDKAIDPQWLRIPPLLLQPFVENAIGHGLRHSQQPDKRLWIRIRIVNAQMVAFEIEDNGIGREKAAHLKRRSMNQRNSYGLEITSQRIALFNRNYPSTLQIQLFDRSMPGQTGTLVQIIYKTNHQSFHA